MQNLTRNKKEKGSKEEEGTESGPFANGNVVHGRSISNSESDFRARGCFLFHKRRIPCLDDHSARPQFPSDLIWPIFAFFTEATATAPRILTLLHVPHSHHDCLMASTRN
eukprot:TRINITY_DN4390_c0_g1_i3.p1 TRINITY_DN4390_c0_g1~~TRINITY_DN4390_c0_g1_i3.p1  ORF type:complete len:110 (+),score=11.72 TRINITY_DN4390_c0_g1_i3:29-358(+)